MAGILRDGPGRFKHPPGRRRRLLGSPRLTRSFMSMAAWLVLWDIDHTLIENAGVSKAVYAAAYRTLTGQEPSHIPVTEGQTDPVIMRGLFAAHGVLEPPWDKVHRALRDAGAAHLLPLRETGHVLPGALAALERLGHRSDVVQAVLTGNIRENATVKLAAFGLDRWVDLDVGAYGSDH
jgi:phosphoglycolate phosphatase